MQRTFLGRLDAIGRFEQRTSFRTFLLAIARNKLYAYLDESRRHRGRTLDFSRVVSRTCSETVELHVLLPNAKCSEFSRSGTTMD